MADKRDQWVTSVMKDIKVAWGNDAATLVSTTTGRRWRINAPDGRQAYVPTQVEDRNRKAQLRRLGVTVGWKPSLLDAAREEERRQRLAADSAALATATERAATAATNATVKDDEMADASELKRRIKRLLAGTTIVDGIPMKVVTLDAEAAERLLEHNVFYAAGAAADGIRTNRPIRPIATQILYATDMVNGNWGMHHQGIAFSTDGFLLDGQTRLVSLRYAQEHWRTLLRSDLPGYEKRYAELERSGVRIKVMLSFGWAHDAVFDRVDQGSPRTFADVAALAGIPDGRKVETVGNLVWAYETGIIGGNYRRQRRSKHEMLEWAQARQPALGNALTEAYTLQHSTGISLTGSAAGIYLIRKEWDGPGADVGRNFDAFLFGLVEGYAALDEQGRKLALDADDPRQALRRRVDTERRSRGNAEAKGIFAESRGRHLALLIIAHGLWVRGRRAWQLSLRPASGFPRVLTPEDVTR